PAQLAASPFAYTTLFRAEERKRLFALPSSSWADYDPESISEGGGVYPRDAKKIELSPQARAVLGTEETVVTPAELIRIVLCAPRSEEHTSELQSRENPVC